MYHREFKPTTSNFPWNSDLGATVLQISASHLPPDCHDWMSNYSSLENHYGWLVNVLLLEDVGGDLPWQLYDALEYVAMGKYDYVWFDCDADPISGLQTWEW